MTVAELIRELMRHDPKKDIAIYDPGPDEIMEIEKVYDDGDEVLINVEVGNDE